MVFNEKESTSMKYLIIVFFLGCIVISSCGNNHSINEEGSAQIFSYPATIRPADGLKNQAGIKLSEVADSIRYVILSPGKAVAVNFVFEVELTDSAIITAVSQCPFLIFDLNGRFIDTIGGFGRGPDEYMPGSKFSIDPFTREIIVYRNFLHDYVRFDSRGRFIDKHPLRFSGSVESFVSLSGNRLALLPAYDGREVLEDNIRNSMILMGIFDQTGNILSEISHPARNIPSDFDASRFIAGTWTGRNTFYNNEVVTPCYDNTVYKINSDSIYPGFRIDWDKLPVPETFEDRFYIRSRSASYPFAEIRGKFVETGSHAFFILKYKETNYLIVYDKIKGTTGSMPFAGDSRVGLINDLDGGQPFFPSWTNRAGDIWIDFVEAIDLRKELTQTFVSEGENVDPGNKEKRMSFINSVQPDDNPVLRIVYLKKHIPENERN